MAVLAQTFNAEIWNSVPNCETAAQTAETCEATKFLKELGKIFVAHKVNRNFALAIVHQHFALNDKEILVETVNESGSQSFSMPWKILKTSGSESIEPSQPEDWIEFGMAGQEKKLVVPQTWIFTEEGQIEAYEFFGTNENLEASTGPPAPFIADLFALLKSLKLEKVFGIRRTWANKLNQAKTNLVGCEYLADDGRRANVVTFNDLGDPAVDGEGLKDVSWSFDVDEGGWIHPKCEDKCYRDGNGYHRP